MTVFQMECALEVARCGNFTRAAENLFISQPTLSRNISQLEEELRLEIFLRQKHQRTQLTPEGECLLDGFRRALDILDNSIRQARERVTGVTYTLRLGVLEGQMLDDRLCAVLNRFLTENKNVRLEIIRATFHALLKMLAEDEVDVITTLDWELRTQSGFDVRPLYRLPTVLVVPKAAVEQPQKSEYSLKDFEKYPFIYVTAQDSPALIRRLLAACEKAGFSPDIREVEDMAAQITQLEMGAGVAGLNPFHSVCSSPNVCCVAIKEFEPQQFSIAWKKNSVNPVVTLFEQWYIHRVSPAGSL